MNREQFARDFDVPRGTLERLDTYVALLAKWNPAINLVSKTTLADAWLRHIADSAQLMPLVPEGARTLVDIGSGAGFPGLVLAILGVPEVHLVESDTRKCTFLREVARATGTPVAVHAVRIENAPDIRADVVSARALASLAELLPMAERFLEKGGVCLFPKGKGAADELILARESWNMRVEQFPSRTDPSATLLRLGEIARVP